MKCIALFKNYSKKFAIEALTPPRRLSSYDDGEENAAHPHMMICRLRRNACIEERCQKGKEDLSQASFKYTHFAVAGKSSYEDERRSLRHHHMMISDAEGLRKSALLSIIPETKHLSKLIYITAIYDCNQ